MEVGGRKDTLEVMPGRVMGRTRAESIQQKLALGWVTQRFWSYLIMNDLKEVQVGP